MYYLQPLNTTYSISLFVSVITKTKKAVEGFCQKSFFQRSEQKTTTLEDFGP